MCGIVGMCGNYPPALLDQHVRAMTQWHAHRGPNGSGHWSNSSGSVALGHRRLSVLDLTQQGHQPMVSRGGRYVLSFNGEIFNHQEIRSRLVARGHAFRGSSDTEVLVQAIEEWGVRKTLSILVGMFAFAVWDENARCLHVARDHFGIKPLFYALTSSWFSFSSEIGGFGFLPGIDRRIDSCALDMYLRYKYVSAPNTIYRGIRRLPPGCLGTYEIVNHQFGIEPYWDATRVASRAYHEDCSRDFSTQTEQLECAIRKAISGQMVADVPLGAFLSGGIDSSLICALMQDLSSRPIRTFTIGFHEAGYDEALHAARIARHIGSEHHELYLDCRDVLSFVRDLPGIIDEPYADASILPSLMLSRLAAGHVKVALSGDGGDELFGGYRHYQGCANLHRKIDILPKAVRALVASFLKRGRMGHGKKARLAGLLRASEPEEFYEAYLSQWQFPERLVPSAGKRRERGHSGPVIRSEEDFYCHMMMRDTRTYLPDDILQKVDLASMRFSLEARVPLLDTRVFEEAWKTKVACRMHAGFAKAPLRYILEKHLPSALFDRPKQGFGVPVSVWLRGEFKEWGNELLTPDALKRTGIFSENSIRMMWHEHQSGKRDHGAYLWTILCLQQWMLYRGLMVEN